MYGPWINTEPFKHVKLLTFGSSRLVGSFEDETKTYIHITESSNDSNFSGLVSAQ